MKIKKITPRQAPIIPIINPAVAKPLLPFFSWIAEQIMRGIEKTVPINEWKKLGFYAAQEILENGGDQLMKELKEQLKK